MQFERRELEDNAVEFYINGDFTIFFLNTIKPALEKDIGGGKVPYFVFDFKDVTYIDSAAISLLIMAGKYNDDQAKKLFIKNPRDVVKRIIDNAELTFVEYLY